MNFDWTAEQAMLRESLARFAAAGGGDDAEARSRARAEPGGWPAERWRGLVELGVVDLFRPEAEGGLGGGAAEIVAATEVWGRAMALEPLTEVLVPSARLAAAAGPGAAPLWEAMAAGAVVVPALFEPGDRHQLGRAQARLTGGRLDGAKQAVWQGLAADHFLVSASGEGGETVVALVAADAEGVSRRGWRAIDGQWAAEVSFSSAHAQPVVAGAQARAALEAAKLAVWLAAAAEMLGLAERLLEATLAYVRERRQFGQPIGRFQAVQHRLADVYVGLEQARSLVYRAAATGDGPGAPATIAAAKAYGAEAARRAGHESVQFHGGMGVSDELAVGHGLKRLRFLMALWGDPADARRAWRSALLAAAA